MADIDLSGEVDLALTIFMDRLFNWLVAQPEWPLLLGTDRQLRRKATGEVAKMLLTIPPVRFAEDRPNRAQLRRFVKQFSKEYKAAILKEVEDDVRRAQANARPAVPADDEDGVRAVLPDSGWPREGGRTRQGTTDGEEGVGAPSVPLTATVTDVTDPALD